MKILVYLLMLGALLPLSAQETKRIEVYIFMHESCRISQFYTKQLNEYHQLYASERLHFKGLFPSPKSKVEEIKNFKEKYQIEFDLLIDKEQAFVKKFNAKVTPEVVVFAPGEDKVLYQGRIDNSYYRVGKRRTVTTTNELKNVLEAISKNKPVETESQPAIGCFIPPWNKVQN